MQSTRGADVLMSYLHMYVSRLTALMAAISKAGATTRVHEDIIGSRRAFQ
jgi:hypothetical protein